MRLGTPPPFLCYVLRYGMYQKSEKDLNPNLIQDIYRTACITRCCKSMEICDSTTINTIGMRPRVVIIDSPRMINAPQTWGMVGER